VTVRALAALVCALALPLAGCASLPTDGPVQEGGEAAPSASAAPFDFNPPGPRPGAAPDEIVTGFLDALQATPVSTHVAQEFLTPQAADAWRPDRSTVVYGGQSLSTFGSEVDVQLSDAFQLDRRGRWAGRYGDGGSGRVRFRLTQVDGEWRIQDPPDAMVVPRPHFESRYQEYSLYFLDPSGSVLVPEPVYLPRGVQAPTQLVAGLLDGPPSGARQVERSYLPRGTKLDVGVPIGPNGSARVPLSDQMLDLDPDELGLASAQLAWTLGQLRDIDSFQITVNGDVLEMPDGQDTVDVDAFGSLDPSVSTASPDLFGLRGREVVQVVGEQEVVATTVPTDEVELIGRPQEVGVDLSSQRFAVVGDRRRVVVVGRTEDRNAHSPYTGQDVLRPMWDRAGDLWLLDRGDDSTRLVVVSQGRTRRLIDESLPGEAVTAAALSRDGSRLVVAQRRASGFVLLLFRVVRDGAGRPTGLTDPIRLNSAENLRHPVALGGRAPTTVAVLVRPSATTTRLALVSCDGASDLSGFEPTVDTLFDEGTSLAASPGGPMALYVGARSGEIHALTAQGRWQLDAVDAGISAPTFVG
jgi:hypothetical protein